MTKVCSKCLLVKPLVEFHKRAAIISGYRSECKVCGCIRRKEYHQKNTSKSIASSANWKKKNPNKVRDYSIRYFIENKDKIKTYRLNNLDKSRKHCAKRRATKKKAMLDWGELNTFVIEEAYLLADLRKGLSGFQWHVNHIIPLSPRNKKVCGLHVYTNLQVIPWLDNLIKSDKVCK